MFSCLLFFSPVDIEPIFVWFLEKKMYFVSIEDERASLETAVDDKKKREKEKKGEGRITTSVCCRRKIIK